MLLSMEGPTPLAPPSDAPTGASPARSLGLPALSDLGAMSTPGGSIRCACSLQQPGTHQGRCCSSNKISTAPAVTPCTEQAVTCLPTIMRLRGVAAVFASLGVASISQYADSVSVFKRAK